MTAPHPQKLTLLSLPPELLVAVLERTAAKTLCRCREVCRQLQELIQETPSLRYKLEIAAADLIDAPPPDGHELALKDRILRISRYRRAWDEMRLSIPRRFPLRALAFERELRHQTWLFHPSGVLVERTNSGSLLCTRMATPLGSSKEKTWTVVLQDVVGDMKTFAVDPAQDLLVVLTSVATGTRVALCSLATGKPHALAETKVIEIHEHFSWIQIQDDIVMVDGCTPYLQLWNWKTGVLVYRFRSCNGQDQVVFLDRRSIISVTQRVIDVHSFDDQPVPLDGDLPNPRCKLVMPQKPEEPRLRAAFAGGQVPVPHSSFCRLDAERSITILTCYEAQKGLRHPLLVQLCVPQATLLDRLASTDPNTSPQSPAFYWWSEWGARGQLAKTSPTPRHALDWPQHNICGSRILVVHAAQDSDAEPELELEVLEYAVVATTGSAHSGDTQQASAPSLRLKRRVTRRVRYPEPRLQKVYLWVNGVVIEGEEAVHIISFEV